MNVDPQVYYDAASKCARMSETMRARVEELRTSLGRCHAMAGEYDGVKEWGAAYDRHAYDFFRAAETWVDASSKLSAVANAAGYNWAFAEYRADPSGSKGSPPVAPASAEPSTYAQCMAPPPTSLGRNGDGLDTDVPGLLHQIGIPVPDGDSDKLTRAADAWNTFGQHDDTTGARGEFETAIASFDNLDAPDVGIMTDHLRTLGQTADQLISTASALAAPVAAHSQSVGELRVEIKSASDDLVWTIGAIGAVTAVAAIATVVLTGGLGALGPAEAEVGAGATAATAAIATAANTIRGLVTVSALASVLAGATATFAAINGVTALSALEAITMLVAQNLADAADATEPETAGSAGMVDESAARFTDRERSVAELLASEGHTVEAVPVSPTERTPDATVDGVPTEFKSLDEDASNSTVKNALNSAKGQADDVVIDGRGSGISEEEAGRVCEGFSALEGISCDPSGSWAMDGRFDGHEEASMSSHHQLFLNTKRGEAEVVQDIQGLSGIELLRVEPFDRPNLYAGNAGTTALQLEFEHPFESDGELEFEKFPIVLTIRNLERDVSSEKQVARNLGEALTARESYDALLVFDLQQRVWSAVSQQD